LSQERPRLRRGRLLAVGIALLLPVAIAFYWVIQRGKLDPQLATDKTLLTVLSTTVAVFAMALGGLLIRNLTRVLAGWRSGPIGSRMQARVALTFLVLTLAPALILSYAAIGIVFRTLRDVQPRDRDKMLSSAASLAEYAQDDAVARALWFSQQLRTDMADLLIPGREAAPVEIVKRLEAARQRYGLTAAGVVPRRGSPLAVAEPPRERRDGVRANELVRLPASLADDVLSSGKSVTHSERMAYGWRAIAIVPLGESGTPHAAVWGAIYIGESIADDIERVVASDRDTAELISRRPSLKRVYSGLFLLVTLVVLFAAIWSGFYFARQITDPILELVTATDALARGELSTRVRERGQDEISQLARRFNRMAGELERARRDLEVRRHYIETLLETVPVGVISVDALGQVSTVNRTALEVLQLDTLQPGADFRAALGTQRDALLDAVLPVIEGRLPRIQVEVPLNAGVGHVSVEVTAERFIIPGRGDGMLLVLADLTQLRRAERNAAWGEVARRVAHEIKNPLTPIRLSAERLLRRFKRDGAEAGPIVEEGVATIVREVESLRQLVDEFSRYGRMPEVSPELGDIRSVVADAVTLYEGASPGIRFEQALSVELPPHRVDREAMRRVLINLLDNAVKALGGRGTISVRVSHHVVHRTVVLEVADDGPGVSDDERQKLFLPNFSRRPGGTGLGLAIAHRIVSEHGGWVRAEPNPAGGTRMIIELPVAEAGAGTEQTREKRNE
jgi:two-component system nitrogen regulation sensor histidine kinase NtrY